MKEDITIEYTRDGYMQLSAYHNDRIVKRKYLYYSKKEAIEHFKQYLQWVN